MSCSPCSFSFLFSVIILHATTWVLGTAYSELYRGRVRPKRVGISLVEVYKRIGKSIILVCKRTWRCQQTHFRAVKKPRKLHGLAVYSSLKRQQLKGVQRSKLGTVEPLFNGHLHSVDKKIWSRKNVHIVFVLLPLLKGIEGTSLFRVKTLFVGPETQV